MDLEGYRPAALMLGFPRPRGDGPASDTATWFVLGVSPPTRGWTIEGGADFLATTGFPAHAGMDP